MPQAETEAEVNATQALAEAASDHRKARMRAILNAYRAHQVAKEQEQRDGAPVRALDAWCSEETHDQFVASWLKDPARAALRFMSRDLAREALEAGGQEAMDELANVAYNSELHIVSSWFDGIGNWRA